MPQGGIVIFFQNFLAYTCFAHVGDHVQENLGDLEVVEKLTFFKNWLKLDQMDPPGMRAFFRPPPNHLNFGTDDLLHKQS